MSASADYLELLGPHVADAATREGLAAFACLLESWSRRHNLVSFASREELVDRHIRDALAGESMLPAAPGRLLDVGSGAGFPGVPLLIARRDWQGTLLEPRRKRWTFLRHLIRELGLPAEATCARFRDFDPGPGCTFDRVVSRALSVDRGFLDWARGILGPTGRLLLWTTEAELKRFRFIPGWVVLSSPLPTLDRGRIAQLQVCSSETTNRCCRQSEGRGG